MVSFQGFSRRGLKIVVYWVTVCLVVLIDQATKAAVDHLVGIGERWGAIVPGLLDLVHIENTGAAFSIGQGASPVFVVVAAVVLGATFWAVWREDYPFPLVFALASVAGGGLGNMIDRLASGSVTDFIATTFIDFPVFNVADMFVTCGVVASLVLYLRWDSGRS